MHKKIISLLLAAVNALSGGDPVCHYDFFPDRVLASVYSVAFVGSALIVFFIFEAMIQKLQKEGTA